MLTQTIFEGKQKYTGSTHMLHVILFTNLTQVTLCFQHLDNIQI